MNKWELERRKIIFPPSSLLTIYPFPHLSFSPAPLLESAVPISLSYSSLLACSSLSIYVVSSRSD